MRLNRVIHLLFLSGALSTSGIVSAQAADQLPQIVEKAILTHPEIGARFQDFMSSLEGQNVSRGALRPQVTAQGWVGREWRSNISDAPSHSWNRHGWSVELRQLLFDGFSSLNNVKQLGFEKLSGYFELLATTDKLALETVDAYLDVQRYREMERLARDNFGFHENTLKQLQERQRSGVGRGVDLEQAHGRLALAQTNLMTESNNLNDVSQRYRRLVGELPANTLLEPPETNKFLPSNPTDFNQSLRSNPSILSKQALFQAAEAGKDSAKGRHMPTLELRASTGRDREQPTAAYRDVQSSRVQLMLSYNLYRGGADAARVRQTAAQTYAARDVRDYTCRNVQQELSIAWNNIVRLRQQIPFLKEHELSTSKVRVAYQQQFQIGERSLLDMLDTENELFDSRRALVAGLYDLKKAEYRWLAQSNRLLSTLGLASPHDSSRPEEAAKLDFPEESLQACLTPVPDTSNLTPIVVDYQHDLRPPIIRANETQPSASTSARPQPQGSWR